MLKTIELFAKKKKWTQVYLKMVSTKYVYQTYI